MDKQFSQIHTTHIHTHTHTLTQAHTLNQLLLFYNGLSGCVDFLQCRYVSRCVLNHWLSGCSLPSGFLFRHLSGPTKKTPHSHELVHSDNLDTHVLVWDLVQKNVFWGCVGFFVSGRFMWETQRITCLWLHIFIPYTYIYINIYIPLYIYI